MGEAAGVPIEPAEQTALADATIAVPGVVAAGVPGAGGFDALFAIILDVEAAAAAEGGGAAPATEATPRSAVESLWVTWPGGGLTSLLLRDGPAMGSPGAGVRLHADLPAGAQ
jgi:phosphomevalonate kinase